MQLLVVIKPEKQNKNYQTLNQGKNYLAIFEMAKHAKTYSTIPHANQREKIKNHNFTMLCKKSKDKALGKKIKESNEASNDYSVEKWFRNFQSNYDLQFFALLKS